jgi:hypothetical protein
VHTTSRIAHAKCTNMMALRCWHDVVTDCCFILYRDRVSSDTGIKIVASQRRSAQIEVNASFVHSKLHYGSFWMNFLSFRIPLEICSSERNVIYSSIVAPR